jgi:hypothetical protein
MTERICSSSRMSSVRSAPDSRRDAPAGHGGTAACSRASPTPRRRPRGEVAEGAETGKMAHFSTIADIRLLHRYQESMAGGGSGPQEAALESDDLDPLDGGASSIEGRGSEPACSFDPETGFAVIASTAQELRR